MQDKTEAATPKRRTDARNKGTVAKSMDLNTALVLLVCMYVIKISGGFMMQGLSGILRDTLSGFGHAYITQDTVWGLARDYGIRTLVICAPVVLSAGLVGFSVNVMQVGFHASAQSMTPDLNKMNPITGMQKLFSTKGLVEIVKSMVKVGLVGYVVYTFLRAELPGFTKLADMSVEASASLIAVLCWRMLLKACAVMAIIAIIDYMYQRYQYEQSVKMTKQEVKDEYRLQEGDPQIKGRIRQKQRQMAKQRMMKDVPKADVIITNPTHLAVAIQYDSEQMSAPVVVAKGQRLVAQKIKEVAAANGVPIVESKPVARALYQAVEVGDRVPEELYQAVAEILAYVYRLSEKSGRSRRLAAG
jgi:flagellar biosynthetic protein FlhB